MPIEIKKGLELCNRYVVSDLLSSGGFATVWRATDKSEGRDVAIKRLLRKGDAAESGRLRVEAEKVALLKGHKNIVEVYECFQEDDEDFLVMEYVNGASLQDTIHKHIRARTWFDADEALDYFRQIVEGLLYAHSSGLYHRDVKPSNILVSDIGVVKLVDFGIARPMVSPDLENASAPNGLAHTGTLSFMSPEQACGGSMDHLTDILSAGIVGYILLTKQHPFNHPSGVMTIVDLIRDPVFRCEDLSPSVVKGVPDGVCRVMAKMLCKDKAARCQSLIQVLNELTKEAAQSCPKCGSPNPTSNSFCGQCGSSLHTPVAVPTLPGVAMVDGRLETAEQLTDRGFQEARAGNWDEAITLYRRAIEVQHDHARAYANLSYSLNRLGKYDDAIQAATDGIGHTGDAALLHRLYDNRGFSKSNLKDYMGAVKDFTRSLEYNHYNPRVLYHRAESKALGGRIDAATVDVSNCLALDPDYPPAIRLKQKLANLGGPKPIVQ